MKFASFVTKLCTVPFLVTEVANLLRSTKTVSKLTALSAINCSHPPGGVKGVTLVSQGFKLVQVHHFYAASLILSTLPAVDATTSPQR